MWAEAGKHDGMTRVRPRSAAALVGGTLAGVAGWDLWQRRHTILRNYPVIGHLRFILEAVGPELRQYIVTDTTRRSRSAAISGAGFTRRRS